MRFLACSFYSFLPVLLTELAYCVCSVIKRKMSTYCLPKLMYRCEILSNSNVNVTLESFGIMRFVTYFTVVGVSL